MKRIAIFCDGTWNRSDAVSPTNVVQLAQAVKPTANDGIKQVTIYLQGVGSGRGVGRFSQWADKVVGGIFGTGLLNNIEEAYRALVLLYEPGDQIYIFGFSRGAYTARSLAGLIRKAGILPRRRLGALPNAIRLYKQGGADNGPDEPHIQRVRALLSPHVATSDKDAKARTRQVDVLRIAYLGVWDTVGALGVPTALSHIGLPEAWIRWWNRRHAFHDTDLSSSVAMARHAVSIDEERATFPPALWSNLEDTADGPGLNSRYPPTSGEEAKYQQLWFAGDHGSVGGGGDFVGLSNITLTWIAKGAHAADLDIDNSILDRVLTRRGLCEPLRNKASLGLVGRALRLVRRPRAWAGRISDVAEPVLWRIRFQSWYKPETLEPLREELEAKAWSLSLLPPK